jgi:predicted nuclease of restriction endonuclease-like (RecB) superfamily
MSEDSYKKWLSELKENIKQRQIKASLAVNSQLILMYWDLGKEIVRQTETSKWGSGFMEQLSKDLKADFPSVSGFSADNLRNIKNFYTFYSSILNSKQLVWNLEKADKIQSLISEQAVRNLDPKETNPLIHENIAAILHIPWGHHVLLLKKIKEPEKALFYVNKTKENNWSRSVLEYQIESNLFDRQGKAITNFNQTLENPAGDLANALLKDPYQFDFLNLTEKVQEQELELRLVQQISLFLMELGRGFAYMGRQFLIKIGSKEYRTDLLFYHTKLRCYIVIELKTTEFEPEFIGKLNFYISAIDEILKEPHDSPTIGILLCKNKDNFEVEFALKDINKPIGVSEYTYQSLPCHLKNSLPTQEELENELKKISTI